MRLMSTAEDPTDPIRELIGVEQTVGLDHFSLAVDPLGLYGVQPRTLLGQKATDDPDPSFATAVFDLAVMLAEPSSYLTAYVPAGIVPDEEQHLLANCFELLTAPRKKAGRYPTHGPTIHEPEPPLVELRHIEPVTGDGLRMDRYRVH
jgi:hypothetical protein